MLGWRQVASKISQLEFHEVKGNLEHLIRQVAYIERLPTPVRNFKATVEWLSNELFQRIAGV